MNINLKRKPLIIIAGPTAVGKTSTSVALAKALQGEIVSADSVQVYRGLDIGSAKVTKEEMEGVPHHLIDVIDVDTDYDVQRFQAMATEAINGIYQRGHVPILVGGTGFYIQALLYGIDFMQEDAGEQQEIETRLQAIADTPGGAEKLYQRLREVDPKSTEKIHAHNLRRVIRALSFYELHGSPISQHNEAEREKTAIYDSLFFVLNDEREKLYQRINARVETMMSEGLLEECFWLRAQNLPEERTSMKGIGYREILAALNVILAYTCGISPEEAALRRVSEQELRALPLASAENRAIMAQAVAKIQQNSRNYAKRQLTWFRRERDVHWVELQNFEYQKEKIVQWIIETCLMHWA